MKSTGTKSDQDCERIYQEIAADLDQFIQNFDDLKDLCPEFDLPQFNRNMSLHNTMRARPIPRLDHVREEEEKRRVPEEEEKRGSRLQSESEGELVNDVKRRLSFSRAFGGSGVRNFDESQVPRRPGSMISRGPSQFK